MRSLLFLLPFALCLACGGSSAPFRSEVNGDRPIQLQATAKLMAWAATGGSPEGSRARLLEEALPNVSRMWSPDAKGIAQTIPVDFDDSPDGECARNNFMMWSIPGKPAIWVCPQWIFCTRGDLKTTLYGSPGCVLHLAHELGHVLGARYHSEQQGRERHGGGSIMCGWASDCADSKLRDFTTEDVALICGDGGHGGRCP